jgi:osmotically-inducible protein OsmY
MWIDPLTVRVSVHDGIVTLAGQLERKGLIPMVVHLTQTVPSVVEVVSQLTYALDDDRLERRRQRMWLP